MNPQKRSEATYDLAPSSDEPISEPEMPTGWEWTPQEVAALLRLRHWYQHGGSDRASVARHLEFLKRLVDTGKLAR